MHQILFEPVSVNLAYDHTHKQSRPLSVVWAQRNYPILEVGLHHSYRHGNTRHHVYSVTSHGLFFRLNLNTDSMSWLLEEVSDGLPD
jgi:hypothetical protein